MTFQVSISVSTWGLKFPKRTTVSSTPLRDTKKAEYFELVFGLLAETKVRYISMTKGT